MLRRFRCNYRGCLIVFNVLKAAWLRHFPCCAYIDGPVGAVAAVGAGATIATVSDISRMQFEDYRRAKTAVGSIYDTLEENALNKYDEQMERVRQNIENNICDLNGEVKNAVVEYDAKIQINAALNLLHEISGRMRRMLV